MTTSKRTRKRRDNGIRLTIGTETKYIPAQKQIQKATRNQIVGNFNPQSSRSKAYIDSSSDEELDSLGPLEESFTKRSKAYIGTSSDDKIDSLGLLEDSCSTPASFKLDSLGPLEESCSKPASFRLDSLGPLEESCSKPASFKFDSLGPFEELCSKPAAIENPEVIDYNSEGNYQLFDSLL